MHKEHLRNKQPEQLPEGVRAYGYRYLAVITTPARTHIIGEFETINEAAQAYQAAASATWNG